MLAIDGRKRQTFDVDLGRALARVKGRAALAGSRARSPRRDPQVAKSLALAKRRRGRSTNSDLDGRNKCKQSGGLFLCGRTLVGGPPMGVRSTSMTAQSSSL